MSVPTPTGCPMAPAGVVPAHGPRARAALCGWVGAEEGRVSDRVHEATHASVNQCVARSKCSSAGPPPRTGRARAHTPARGRASCAGRGGWCVSKGVVVVHCGALR